MNALKNSIDCISNDELMLKELERRDGIYSFIFHELETPKSKTLTSASEQHANQQVQLKRHAYEADFVAEEQLEEELLQQQQLSAACCSKTAPGSAEQLQRPTGVMQRHFQEYLKPWNPPPTLVYDHPQLYAYMANCGFRVRVPPPRFSHVTAPLVRNRRHALKDSPEYKRCGVCLLNIPDLRTLFPCDPDVHAPFVGAQNKPHVFNKYID